MVNQLNEKSERVGLWKHYHSNGRLASKGYYIKGRRDGVWINRRENGKLDSIVSYKNGHYYGPCEYYNSDGKLDWRGEWKDFKMRGLWYRQAYAK